MAVYTQKQELIDLIEARLADNSTNDITAFDTRQTAVDIVDSLWNRTGGGGCNFTNYLESNEYMNVAVQVRVCGLYDVSIFVYAEYFDSEDMGAPNGYVSSNVSFNNIISNALYGGRWFKLRNFYSVINTATGGLTDFGGIELIDVNSRVSGAIQPPDSTLLFFPGSSVGSKRTYNFDQVDAQYNNYDRTEAPFSSGNNYVTQSDFDLLEGDFSIKVHNNVSYLETQTGGPIVGTIGNKIGIVSCLIEGTLIG